MLGMIKKDIFMIRNNLKTLIFAIFIYLFYTMMFDMDMSIILPFMIVIICISTFSYDDYNNWHSFAAALPKGKTNIVKSKYITTISLTIIATIISIICTFIISNFKTTINFSDAISSISGCLFAIFILLKKVINISIPDNIIMFFDSYGLIIFLLLSIIFISVSYLISKKIYLKKEF